MSVSYRKIIETLQEIEKEYELPTNTLKEIYDAEKDVVFMGRRIGIDNTIRDILMKKLNTEPNRNYYREEKKQY